jgi:hypothetical protein
MKANKKKPDIFTWLRSGLRKLSQRHAPIYEAKAAAKRPYTGDNPRQRVCFECAECKALVANSECAVDHIEEAGQLTCWDDLGEFARKLFCDKEGLQVLCHNCHDIKTYMAKNSCSKEEAEIQKCVINILKTESKEDVINFIEMWDFEETLLTNNEASRRISLLEIYKFIYKE